MEPARLANDMDKIATWCQNLVYIDEESLVVQAVHTSVRTFLLEESNEPSLSMFHLDADRADHKLGEICLTYLDFDVFNAVTIRPKPLPVASPIGIVNSIAKPMSKEAKLLSKIPFSSSRSTFDLRPSVEFENSRAATISPGYDVQHPFLAYASRHWISHTTRLQEGTSTTWHILRQIIIDGRSVATLPWVDGFQLTGTPRTSLAGVSLWDRDGAPAWAWQNGHHAATCILVSPGHSILKTAALGDNYDLFDAMWNRPGLETPINILVYGAMVGHLPAVDTIIAKVYNVDIPVELVTTVSNAHVITSLLKDIFAQRFGCYPTQPDEKSLIAAVMKDTKLNDPVNLQNAFEAAPYVGLADLVAIPLSNGPERSDTPKDRELFMTFTKDGNPQGFGFSGDLIALSEASRRGHLEVVEVLLAAGATVFGGSKAFNLALRNDHRAVIARLSDAKQEEALYGIPKRSAKHFCHDPKDPRQERWQGT